MRRLLTFTLLSACSLSNREGPDVTCADLDNGIRNACTEGIIATCSAPSKVAFLVCSDEDACSASWQSAGQYRCNETDSLPTLRDQETGATAPTPTEGSATCGFSYSDADCASCTKANCCASAMTCSGDTECSSCITRPPPSSQCVPGLVATYDAFAACIESSCASQCSDVTVADDPGGAEGPDGSNDNSGDGGSTSSGCGDSEVCQVAQLGSGNGGICARAQDAKTLYLLSDRGGVWTVPKAGGPLKRLATGDPPGAEEGEGGCALAVDGSHVYFPSSDSVKRVALSGGPSEPVGKAYDGGLVVDATHVFWVSMNSIARMVKSTKATDSLASNSFDSSVEIVNNFLVADQDNLYWIAGSGLGINAISKKAASSDAPSSYALGEVEPYGIAADASRIYLASRSSFVSLDPASGATVTLARTDGTGDITAMGVGPDHVYFSDRNPRIVRIAKATKKDSVIAAQGATLIVGDSSFVFFLGYGSNATKVFRAPK